MLLHSDVQGQADVLGRADGATRERGALHLQREYGNAYVQHVMMHGAAVQRDGAGTMAPPGPAPGAPVGKGTWLQPFPPTVPRIHLDPAPEFQRLRTLVSGHPRIGSMPLPTAEDLAQIEEANGYFESTPLEDWEPTPGGEYTDRRNRLTDLFQRKAYELTLYTLEQSEAQAADEQFRYAPDDAGADSAETVQLREAATHLAEVQEALLRLANNEATMEWTHYHQVVDVWTLDDYISDPLVPEKKDSEGHPSYEDNWTIDPGSRAAIEQFPVAAAQYKVLREVYGQRFPVLMGANQDYQWLANATPAQLAGYAYSQTRQVQKNIDDVRTEFSAEKIWALPIVIEQTKALLGITPGSGADDAIEGKRNDDAWDAAIRKLALAALQVGLQIVAAGLSGGTSVALQVAGAVAATAGAAVTAVSVGEEIGEYGFQKALTSRISLDSAQRLADGEPGYGWLAFDIVGMIVDIGAAAAAFRHVAMAMKAAQALGDARKAAELAATLATVEGAASSASALTDVEKIVRAQARTLAQEGKLAEGLTEDLFVERVMAGLRRQVAAHGAIAEQQATLLGRVIEGTHPRMQALLAGDREALIGLLTEHGEWKSLVMGLERGGQKQIAEHLMQQRDNVIADIAEELKAASREPVPSTVSPMTGGSEELVSDVDLQIAGADAGQMMVTAEAYMARRYGANWSQMFRLNFYTEGSRLTRYQEVLSALKPAEQLAMTERITAQVERYTFARMMQHAADDPAALARVESMAERLGIDLEQLRPLAAMDDTARTARRDALLIEIDGLQASYGTAKGARRAELAEEISAKQIEANFHTYEANIGPGSLKLSGVRGLKQYESYQAALTQLEMIEHILAAAGGDVARASREYELFKYIGRFGTVAETAGKDSARLKFLRNQAKAVAGGQREMMEESAHAYLDADKVRRGGATHADLPQHTGSTPPVTDDYLIKTYDMFREEAAETMTRLHPTGVHRSP